MQIVSFFLSLLAAALLLGIVAAPPPVEAQELLKNGDFRAPGDGKLATHWHDASQGLRTAPEFSVASTEGPDTAPAQKITVAKALGEARARLAQNLATPAPGSYRFRVQLKADAKMQVQVQVRLASRPGTVYGTRRLTLEPKLWTPVSGIAFLPDPQTVMSTLAGGPALPTNQKNEILFVIELRDSGTVLAAQASLRPTGEAALTPLERRELEARRGPELPPVDEEALVAEIDARIRKYRTGPLTVQVADANGSPLANQKVQVKHLRHGFKFGSDQLRVVNPPRPEEAEIDKRHREAYLRLFNYSTVQFYWGSYEPQRGQYQHEAELHRIQWLKENGITPRGHTIFWNQTNALPRWFIKPAVSTAEMRQLMDTRLQQLSKTILPQLSDVDVWNELIQWDRFQNPLTDIVDQADQGVNIALVTHYLKEFKRLNPHVQAVVNDYDATPLTYDLLKRLIEAGAPIDIIGQQTHSGLGGSPKRLWTLLERLSLLKRPVLLSELSIMSGRKRPDGSWPTTPEGEARQAEEMETFYKLAYSHPNVIGVVIWNFSDYKSALSAPRGFLRQDGSPKPSFLRVDNLINKQWRTNGEFTTDARGIVTIPSAFEGEYEVVSGSTTAKGGHSAAKPLRIVLRHR